MSAKEELEEALGELTALIQGVSLEDPAVAKREIQELAPFDGALVARLRTAAAQGADEGWLTPREAGGVRFGRVAKALHGFSVDAVEMSGAGPRHRHPGGEIDLCFRLEGDPRFDGHPEGWVIYAPGSVHVPTVREGSMRILYLLPGGAIEFLNS